MSKLYLEPFSGISGNMFIGLLLDLGYPYEELEKVVAALHLSGYRMHYEKVSKRGVGATHFDVELVEAAEQGEAQWQHATLEHSESETLDTAEHQHATHHHQPSTLAHHHHSHAGLREISAHITESILPHDVQEGALIVLQALAQAESRVHGVPVEEVHFHEVGAVDTLIDIVGTVAGLKYLGIDDVAVGRIYTGWGFVRCAHGLMPVPAPATALLLTDFHCVEGSVERELVTPTGAALLMALASESLDCPGSWSKKQVGYGAGTYDLDQPNVVRGYLCVEEVQKEKADISSLEAKVDANALSADKAELLIMEANIDDLDERIYAYVADLAFSLGAKDVYQTPIVMKKGRLAHKLSILARREDLVCLSKMLLQETTTLGVRYYPVERVEAERTLKEVKLSCGASVKVKIASFAGSITNIQPEYEDCVAAAKEYALPLKEIIAEARTLGKDAYHG